jgi:hypothetical protein
MSNDVSHRRHDYLHLRTQLPYHNLWRSEVSTSPSCPHHIGRPIPQAVPNRKARENDEKNLVALCESRDGWWSSEWCPKRNRLVAFRRPINRRQAPSSRSVLSYLSTSRTPNTRAPLNQCRLLKQAFSVQYQGILRRVYSLSRVYPSMTTKCRLSCRPQLNTRLVRKYFHTGSCGCHLLLSIQLSTQTCRCAGRGGSDPLSILRLTTMPRGASE